MVYSDIYKHDHRAPLAQHGYEIGGVQKAQGPENTGSTESRDNLDTPVSDRICDDIRARRRKNPLGRPEHPVCSLLFFITCKLLTCII